MDALFYMMGSWSRKDEIPKPGRPLQCDIPDIPDGATNDEINQILADAGLITIDADGKVDNTELVIRLIFNGQMVSENKEAKKAYNDAVYQAIQNQATEGRAQAESQARSRSADKKFLAKAAQMSTQQNKALERALMSRMIGKWMSERAAENKRKKVEGK